MHDPILEEIWRVREQLIKDHGGLDSYLSYIEKLDAEDRRRQRNRKVAAKARRLKARKQKAANGSARLKQAPFPKDPILDEIRRVRQELLKKHGGLDGYLRYIEKLDADRRRHERRRKLAAKARRHNVKKPKARVGNSRPAPKKVA